MEAIPRTTRAQAMDALSSQAAVAGYAATLIAARESGRFFGMMTTAAGTVAAGQGARPRRRRRRPAGDRDREAARRDRHRLRHPPRRLGADRLARRPPAGARLHPRRRGRGRLRAARSPTRRTSRSATRSPRTPRKQDVIVTTAAIPGRPAPLLITAEAVRGMAPGSVIVDLAAETGGNCELTEAGETVGRGRRQGDRPAQPRRARCRGHASQLYAKNLENLLGLLVGEEGKLKLDFEDDIIAAACITHDGEIRERAGERKRWSSHEPDDRDHDLRPRRLRRLRGDLEGADDAAHAADVADQRDPRDRDARRPDRRRLRQRRRSST